MWVRQVRTRSGFALSATASFRDRKIGVEIYISLRAAKAAFDQLQEERLAIEAEFGGPLDWQRLNDRKACRITVYRTDLDPNMQQQWPEQHAWFLDQLQRFVHVLRSRIDALDIDSLEDRLGEQGIQSEALVGNVPSDYDRQKSLKRVGDSSV